MGLTGKGECSVCGNIRTLPAKGKCDKCYRAEFYEKNPEALAQRLANQKARAAKYYEQHGEEMRERMRLAYEKKKAEGGGKVVRRSQAKRKPRAVSKKDAEKATDVVYNSSAKRCCLCERKLGRAEVMLWGEELDVAHKVCGWAAEARANIARREHGSETESTPSVSPPLSALQLERDQP